MKIFTWNVNGLRSAFAKGFCSWVAKEKPDIICLQEIKANESDLPTELTELPGYFSYFNSAKKKGYAGVAVYSKKKPLRVCKNLGLARFDSEGRLLKLDFTDFILLCLYMPHGGRQKENLGYKMECYSVLFEELKRLKGKKIIIAGDFNIAHEEVDLARPKANKKNIIFTEEERSLLGKLIESGFFDTFRFFNKETGHYTWWPYMANARQRNLGWRIDYIFASASFESKLTKASIEDEVPGSDHCPAGLWIKQSS